MELDYSSCVLITQIPQNYKSPPVQLKHNKFWNTDNPISLFVWPSHKNV